MRPPLIPPAHDAWTMSDGYTIHGRIWGPPRADGGIGVVYLHGIQSHGGWFEHSASFLHQAGAAVLLPDRRGSGLNTPARGDVLRADRWLDDLDELAVQFAARYSLRRIAVLGVSWGGKLALAWLLRRPALVSHALLIAPGVCPAVDVGLWARLRIALALLTDPTRRFRIPLDDPTLFTDTPAGQAFIAGDPLKLSEVTARFLYHSSRLDHRLRCAGAGAVCAITAVFVAGRERIINNARTLAGVQRLVAGGAGIHHFPYAAHTIEFEADPKPLLDNLTKWLSETTGNPIQT